MAMGWLRRASLACLRVVPRLVGCLLVVAAMLKGSSAALGQIVATTEPAWGGPWAQIALVQVEFVLGVALLWRPSNRVLRWAAMTLFAVFLAALVLMLREGRTSCGCGGGWIRVSPWVALCVDSWVVVLLAAGLAVESRLGSKPGPSCPVAAAGE